MHAWASDLALAYLYAIPPSGDGVFTDGDLDNDKPTAMRSGRPLLASMAGLGSDQAASFGASFVPAAERQLHEDCPVFDALAEARGAKAVDFTSTMPPLWYLAKGTRKLFARSSWKSDATFAYFTAAPRLVPDHQHNDASSFVLVRGSDWVIADPSPYGSLSTLTGNALDIDSNAIDPKAKPSQSIWENQSSLPWAKGVATGIVAARAELSGAFHGVNDKPSDVPFARRDWAYLPEGDIVTIDRARTDDPSRAMHVRFRTPATNLALSQGAPWTANGTVGGSAVFIQAATLSGGTPSLKPVGGGGTCDNVPFGQCAAARFAVTEYDVDVPGPQMVAVHVIDGVAASDQAPAVLAMDRSEVTGGAKNDGVVGALVKRAGVVTAVVASSAKDGAAGAQLSYTVPGDTATRHVVFDAPEDASGSSNITTSVSNGHCVVSIGAGGGFAGRPLVFTLSGANGGCSATEDKPTAPGSVQGGGGGAGTISNPESAANGSSGCGCSTTRASTAGAWAALAAGALAFVRRRVRRGRGLERAA